MNHSLTGANNRRRDHRARTKKTQEHICDFFYHFPCLSPEREIREVGKNLRKENTKFEKKLTKKRKYRQMTEELMMKLGIEGRMIERMLEEMIESNLAFCLYHSVFYSQKNE